MDSSNPPFKKRISLITWFLCVCAGANMDALKQCPRNELVKYSGIGTLVLATGIMASLSGGYFLFSVFDSLKLAVAFGLFWGLLIFSLDRYLVSTMDSVPKGKRLYASIPRLILAVLLAMVISQPLELKFFEKEIDNKLTRARIFDNDHDTDNSLISYDNRIQKLQTKIDTLNKDIQIARGNSSEAYQKYLDEFNGKGGTGREGYGKEAERLDTLYEQSLRDLGRLEKKNTQRVDELTKKIDDIKQEKQDALAELKKSQSISDGPLERTKRLKELAEEEFVVRLLVALITLVFILIEIAPVVAKLLIGEGAYQKRLAVLEKFEESEFNRSVNNENKSRNLVDKKKAQDRKQEEVTTTHRENLEFKREALLEKVASKFFEQEEQVIMASNGHPIDFAAYTLELNQKLDALKSASTSYDPNDSNNQ